MQKTNPAGFWVRSIASINDFILLISQYSLTFYLLTFSKTPEEFGRNLIVAMILVVLPSIVLASFFLVTPTHMFGGSFGKLLTGLRVVAENGKKLDYKRNFFRHTVGYSLSGVFFGLGFFAIFKDPEKRAWHDKAAGSKVINVQNLWPIGVLAIFTIIALNYFLISEGIKQISPEVKNAAIEAFTPKEQVKADVNTEFYKKYNDFWRNYAENSVADNTKGADDLKNIATTDFENGLVENIYAEILLDQENTTEAENHSVKAVQLAPDDGPVNHTMAKIYLSQDKAKEALAYAIKATTLEPQVADYHYTLSLAYFFTEDIEKAKESLTKAIEISPENETYKKALEEISKK